MLFLIAALLAQTEPLPAGYPDRVIPRQYSDLDPLDLFEKVRAEGTFPLIGKPTQSRLLVQNMDADDDMEYVLVFEASYKVAIVMKQVDGKWWTLGTLMSKHSGELDTFVSLKPLVSPGTNDLIVRAGGSQGTGVGMIGQTVYRILHANLYPVFDAVEEEWNWTSSKTAKIIYPEESSLGTILVREPKSCKAFHWNPKSFSFVSQNCPSK